MSLVPYVWAKKQTVITTTIRTRKAEDGQKVRVESQPTPSPLDKLVLLGIADETSESDWTALIGTEDLAVYAGVTRRSIRESLDRLERAGFIRVRPTRVESGAQGWNRIYMLHPDSPLVLGQIEVDWTTPEQIRRYEMRTHARRDASPYVPSDSPRAPRKPAGEGEEEPGSAYPEDAKGRRNHVPPTGRNHVPGEEEPRSAPGEEPGSAHRFSSQGSSVSEREREGSAQADEHDEHQADEHPRPRLTLVDAATPSAEALDLIVNRVSWGAHCSPNDSEARALALLVDAAVESGRTWRQMRRHVLAKVRSAKAPDEGGNAVAWLRGGLHLDRLPAVADELADEQDAPAAAGPSSDPDRRAELLAAVDGPKFLPTRLRQAAAATAGTDRPPF